MTARQLAVRLLPPIITDAIRRVIHGRTRLSGRFEVVGPVWPLHDDSNPGWEDAGIAQRQAEQWPSFVESCKGTDPLDMAHESVQSARRNMTFHGTYLKFGYVLALASRGEESVSMLDWGGGLGHYAVLGQALLPDVQLEYHCKDLPTFCEQGRKLLPEATFYDDDSCLDRTYDLVMASGSLQCSRDWKTVSEGLARATGRYFFITRVPMLMSTDSLVIRQHAEAWGFNDDLLGWFLNRDEFLEHLDSLGMELVREFYVDEYPEVVGSEEQPDVRGYLFRPR